MSKTAAIYYNLLKPLHISVRSRLIVACLFSFIITNNDLFVKISPQAIAQLQKWQFVQNADAATTGIFQNGNNLNYHGMKCKAKPASWSIAHIWVWSLYLWARNSEICRYIPAIISLVCLRAGGQSVIPKGFLCNSHRLVQLKRIVKTRSKVRPPPLLHTSLKTSVKKREKLIE